MAVVMNNFTVILGAKVWNLTPSEMLLDLIRREKKMANFYSIHFSDNNDYV